MCTDTAKKQLNGQKPQADTIAQKFHGPCKLQRTSAQFVLAISKLAVAYRGGEGASRPGRRFGKNAKFT